MNDYTSDIADFWSTIIKAWQENRNRHPVIECNLFERKVLAYPAKEYINTLSERTRFKTLRQYEQVTAQGGMMVFINDYKKRILQSYIFNAEDIELENLCSHRMRGGRRKAITR
jgi:hypothetical protein